VDAPFPRVTLFVPGVSAAARESFEADVECEWIENDGRFGAAFSFGTVGRDVIEKLEATEGALVAYPTVDLRDGREQIIALVERMRDLGGIAVRIEQSKLGWEISEWLELVSSIAPQEWHRAAVTFLREGDEQQSCGMHAFSLPDVYMKLDGDPSALQTLATALNVYQLAEDPVMVTGQTFAPDADTPRRVVERWPDLQYPPSHPCHNPYGVWRLGPPGGRGRSSSKLIPVFVPALHPVLMALERKNGAPLTQEQVESARDNGHCIMMDVRDAQMLERSRGYADLDPERAWEQWQLVREQGH
jgi:hypothetical protein